MSAARQGDLEAFNRLVAAHQDQLYALSYRALGDKQTALEAVQSAVRQARVQIRRCDGGSFRLWLLQQGVQACLERMRWTGETAEAGLPARLCRLPEALRLAIILVDVVGLDYREAATVLGASRDQVSRHVAEARWQLMRPGPDRAAI